MFRLFHHLMEIDAARPDVNPIATNTFLQIHKLALKHFFQLTSFTILNRIPKVNIFIKLTHNQMINLYEILKNHPGLSRQLNCRDLLFTNYDCPQATGKERFFVECNYIAYVLNGKRTFHKNGKTWDLKEGVCVFVKKGTYIAEKEEDEGWCVMVLFIPDSFLKQLINENRQSLS